jgi:hypothetical protein
MGGQMQESVRTCRRKLLKIQRASPIQCLNSWRFKLLKPVLESVELLHPASKICAATVAANSARMQRRTSKKLVPELVFCKMLFGPALIAQCS